MLQNLSQLMGFLRFPYRSRTKSILCRSLSAV